MKNIETRYKKPLEIIKKFIKKTEEGFKESENLLHLHGKFGSGKSVIINTISEKDKIVHDEFPMNKNDVDNLFIAKNPKEYIALEKRRKSLSVVKKLLFFWINLSFAFTVAYIPATFEFSNWWIKVVPAYFFPIMLVFATIYIVCRLKVSFLKGKVIVIENIDRIKWDDTVYLLNKAYKNKSNKYIFTYSMSNLSDRYFEKYSTRTNLYMLLDKFIDIEINLEDYKKTYGQLILDEISIDTIDQYSFKLNISTVDNFRLVNRSLDNLIFHASDIKVHSLNPELIFHLNYLKISDNLAYKYLFETLDYIEKEFPYGQFKWFEQSSYDIALSMRKHDRGMREPIINDMPSEFQFSKKLVAQICNLGTSLKFNHKNFSNFRNHFIDENIKLITKKMVQYAKENKDVSQYMDAISRDSLIPRNIVRHKLDENYSFLNSSQKVLFFNLYKENKSIDEIVNYITSIDFSTLDIFEKMSFLRCLVTEVIGYFPNAWKFQVKPQNYVSISSFFESFSEFNSVEQSDSNKENFNKLKCYLADTFKILKKDFKNVNAKKWISIISGHSEITGSFHNWEIYEILLITKKHPLSYSRYFKYVEEAFKDSKGRIPITLFHAFFGGSPKNYELAKKANIKFQDFNVIEEVEAKDIIDSNFINAGNTWANLYNNYRKLWNMMK